MRWLLPAALAALAGLAPDRESEWTVLVYGAVDNSSEASFCPDMADLMSALGAPGVEVLAFVDRSPLHSDNPYAFGEDFAGSRLYRLAAGGARRVAGGDAFSGIHAEGFFEANSGDAGTLARAIRWARREAPSRRFALLFYSHGNGKLWCPDDTDDDHLFPAELTDVLEESDSVDLAIFDVCSMASVENAYQWRPRPGAFGIDFVVATPMAGFPFPWQRVFRRLGADGEPGTVDPKELTPAAFGRLVVEETAAARREELEGAEDLADDERAVLESEAMAVLDLARAGAVKESIDGLARALAGWDDGRDALAELRGPTLRPALLHYVGDGPGWAGLPFVDPLALGAALADAEDEAVAAAARELVRAVDALVLDSYGLVGYDAHGGFEAGRHGAHVTLPGFDQPEGRPAWAHVDWLHPDPLDGSGRYGRYAWCADGCTPGNGVVENWFELCDAWLDVRDGEGGANGYRY